MQRIIMITLLLLLPFSGATASVYNVFLTPNQQGAKAMRAHNYPLAAKQFKTPQWKASAYYKNKQWQKAANLFKTSQDARGLYNYGNSLAQLKKYPEAIKAYQSALKIKPQMKDAKYNLAVIKKLMHQKNQSSSNKPSHANKKGASHSKSKSSKSNNKTTQQSKSNPKPQSGKQSKQQKASPQSNNPATQQHKQIAKTANNSATHHKSAAKQPPAHASQQRTKTSPTTPATQTRTPAPTKQTSSTPLKNPNELKKWLRNIPDNPGGLLERKFRRDYRRYQQGAPT